MRAWAWLWLWLWSSLASCSGGVARADAGGSTPAGTPALPTCDQRYVIDARLDSHVVTGHERILFTNHSNVALQTLTFHLYMNAFRDQHSVFMREGGAALRGTKLGHGNAGSIELESLTTQAGADLLTHAQRELVAGDFTQLRVTLPTPLPAGASLELELRFRTLLPKLVARAGYAGDFNMVAQWYPKLAKLEPDGRWASFPYHGLGEFYADFADYELNIDVPASYVIGASGVHVRSDADNNGRRRQVFQARAVPDVAFAAYPDFERIEGDVDVDGARVRANVLAPRGHGQLARHQLELVSSALQYFARRLGPYPYSTLTVIMPPSAAGAAAGMEYPALFVSSVASWATPPNGLDSEGELVAAHELAHQWFSVMLGSDEVEHPFLDEGLAEWAALDFLRARDAHGLIARTLGVDAFDVTRALYAMRDTLTPSSLLPAYRFRYETLARGAYMRPALAIDALERRCPADAFQRGLSAYVQQYRFAHPAPADLFAVFDSACHASARGFLAQALSGQDDAMLVSKGASAPAERSWFSDWLFAAQALLGMVGP